MLAKSDEDYVNRAVCWASEAYWELVQLPREHGLASVVASLSSQNTAHSQQMVTHRLGRGKVFDLRRQLFLSRDTSRLHDTKRWTYNFEKGVVEAWRRWETGEDDPDLLDPIHIPKTDQQQQQQSRSPASSPSTDLREYMLHVEEEMKTTNLERGVFAPKGRSIWVIDDDDGMPSHTKLRQMI